MAQSLATVAAIFLGALFAWRNGHIFRYGQPHLTVNHEISHRRVSQGYLQVAITATLHNRSRVKVEVLDGLFTVQQMGPVSDEAAEELFAETFLDNKHNGALQWATLREVRLSWNREDLIAEPGESTTATFEYMVPTYVESILITTYFYNSRVVGKIENEVDPRDAERARRWWFWRKPGPRGWLRTTPHDIIVLSEAPNGQADGV